MDTVRMRSAAVVMFGALVAGGCGGTRPARSYELRFQDNVSGENVALQQGAMPTNSNWTGVYNSPQIGRIELVQTGDSVVGSYEYDRGSCHVTARIEGSTVGNLLRFQWTENHRPCGRLAPVVGRAYFIFWTDNDGQRGRIDGEWGYGEEDRGGGRWSGFQLRGQRPRALEESQSGGAPASGDGSSGGSGDGSGSSGGGS